MVNIPLMETARLDSKEDRMEINEVYNLIKVDLDKVEQEFKKHLNSKVYLITKLGEYVMLSGGKRFRPTMLVLSSKLCGYKGDRHILFGSIVEYIHTATLLHDDVVDDAKLRRGQSSANSVWGNGASVLVGDFFFSKSFYLMVKDSDIDILRIMSKTTTFMAEGEVLQLLKCSDIETTEDEYISVVSNKTASLISAACQIGAILGKVSKEKERALKDFGFNLGIAFQLMDDCLDYTSKNEELGKAIGNDLKEGKVTLPLIHTLKQCSNSNERGLIIKAVEEGDMFAESNLTEVVDLIKKYKGIDYTMSLAGKYLDKAKESLNIFDDDIFHSALLTVADYVVERRF